MKKLLAVAIVSAMALGAACAQDTGGDKARVSKSNTGKTAEKSSVKAGAGNTSAAKGPKAQPFPTRKPADKTELNPQPLPPGARNKSVTPAEKTALNPQPLPPGAKMKNASPAEKVALNPQPLPPGAKAKAQTQRKVAADKSKKGSAAAEKGSITQK